MTSKKNWPKDQTKLELVACDRQVFLTVAVLNGGGEGTGHGGGGHPGGMGGRGGKMVWVERLLREGKETLAKSCLASGVI